MHFMVSDRRERSKPNWCHSEQAQRTFRELGAGEGSAQIQGGYQTFAERYFVGEGKVFHFPADTLWRFALWRKASRHDNMGGARYARGVWHF